MFYVIKWIELNWNLEVVLLILCVWCVKIFKDYIYIFCLYYLKWFMVGKLMVCVIIVDEKDWNRNNLL